MNGETQVLPRAEEILDVLEFPQERRAELTARRRGWELLHVGETRLRIGDVLDLITGQPGLLPPRTGHVGNWDAILAGRSGAMDFNAAICRSGFGAPLLHAFNQTETADASGGDGVYLPGSLVEDGVRRRLPLRTWDGSTMRLRDGRRPLFTPFVWTHEDGDETSLVRLHLSRLAATGLPCRLESDVLVDHLDVVRQILTLLIREALAGSNPHRGLGDLLAGQVLLDGEVRREAVAADGAGVLLVDGTRLALEELVEAALVPLVAASRPEEFREQVGSLPGAVPLLSATVVSVLSAMLSSHYPGGVPDRAAMTSPVNPHVHWGARHMAGYPPRVTGYLSSRSTVRRHRRVADTIVAAFASVDPVAFVLLPAFVFALWPAGDRPEDADAVAELLGHAAEGCRAEDPELRQQEADRVVGAWLAGAGSRVSGAFLDRFRPARGILRSPGGGAPLEPQGFRDLDFGTACALLGALHHVMEDRL